MVRVRAIFWPDDRINCDALWVPRPRFLTPHYRGERVHEPVWFDDGGRKSIYNKHQLAALLVRLFRWRLAVDRGAHVLSGRREL